MNILSLESSTEYLSVALGIGDAVIDEEIAAGQRHSELILDLVARLLDRAGVGVRALDAVAFGAGPGSFTGLRIACGAAQGIAFAHDLPVVPVDAFRSIAATLALERVAVAIDARMNEVYFAALVRGQAIAPGVVVPPERVAPLPGAQWCAAGTGFAVHGESLRARLGDVFTDMHPHARPQARSILQLARADFAAGRAVDAALATPLYVRDRVARTIAERSA